MPSMLTFAKLKGLNTISNSEDKENC